MSGLGLSFKKLDLHVHTPASADFRDKSVTPEDIVQKAIAEELDAIAITDHNSGEWIDCVKNAARGTELVVFPGVEISCTGGKEGIHLIALLDIDKGTEHITGLLNKLGITPGKQGDTRSLADQTPKAIIDVIQASDWQGIAIPAHVTSSKGILEDMRGQQRIEIIQHPNLIAVEATCFQKEHLKREGKRAVDLLDGNDPAYRRKLAVYQASDNPSGTAHGGHGLHGIGSRCTYFKMQRINLESLRQCFLDPDVRISQDFEYTDRVYPRIDNVSIAGGFLDGQSVVFNEGLNSIIGGKGTGKSLLVELMRFVLDQSPDRSSIRDDHDRKLEERLGKGGYVELEFTAHSGEQFPLKRTYDSGGSYYDETGFDPSQLFPVLFLSQNEIIKISESEPEQLKFIDRFFDFNLHRRKIKTVEDSLMLLDRKLEQSMRAVEEVAALEQRISTLSIQLQSLDSQLSDSIFQDYQRGLEKTSTLKGQIETVQKIEEILQGSLDAIGAITRTRLPEAMLNDPESQRIETIMQSIQDATSSQLRGLIKTVAESRINAEKVNQEWDNGFSSIRKSYNEHVRKQGGDYQSLAGQQEKAQQELSELRSQLVKSMQRKDELTAHRKERNSKLDELEEAYADYRAARESRCDHFQSHSNGRLHLRIKGSTNTDTFKQRLLALKVGSRLQENDIDDIVTNKTPREFIDSILEYHLVSVAAVENASEYLDDVARDTGLTKEKVTKLANVLLGEDKILKLLELQYKAHPQDRPEIKFNVGRETFVSLESLSVGQKSTALLVMALSDGKMPVVIDQPEDSLDIRSIWEDICSKVRSNKTQRQFIFTTHNSNVAVASDTDNYIILEADADYGRVVNSGSMDHSPVADEVLTYMEGGNDSYHRKSTKYQTENPLSRS